MAESKPDAPRPFDARMVEHLIGLMTKNDLSEIDLSEGEHRIRLRKGFAPPANAYTPSPIAGGHGAALGQTLSTTNTSSCHDRS